MACSRLSDELDSQHEPEDVFARSLSCNDGKSVYPEPINGSDEALFVQRPDPDYKCPVCSGVARSPMQGPCGHLFCATCFERLPKRHGSFVCPRDGLKHREDYAFPDQRTNRKVLQLKVKCLEHAAGCKQEIELRYLQDHVAKECTFAKVQCPEKCGVIMPQAQIKNHVKNMCINRKFTCSYCRKLMTFWHYKNGHKDLFCDKIVVACPKCKQEMLREKFRVHLSDCPRVEIKCEYAHFGCSFTTPRESMPQHLATQMQEHADLMLAYHKDVKEKVFSMETYLKAKALSLGTFVWTIQNWSRIDARETVTLTSPKFQLADAVYLQMRLRASGDWAGNRFAIITAKLFGARVAAFDFMISLGDNVHSEKAGRVTMRDWPDAYLACYTRARDWDPEGPMGAIFGEMLYTDEIHVEEFPARDDVMQVKLKCSGPLLW
ncbi:TNF receptor-associated factor 5-like [Oscarella lobularis]|uniref:TNF receptor-associated factor 5-like n=1 Tax=Oscarella lobularis TaxID=121494 RepID=UPI003313CB9F